MTLLGVSIAYLRDRYLNTALNILLLTLAVATMVILILFSSQLGTRLQRDSEGIDLVVGAKGSPLQLILSSIYEVDVPTGNIPLSTIPLLRRDPAVAEVMPLALGDNFRSFRIVGTEPNYPAHYGAKLRDGGYWTKPYEAVIGSEVVKRTGAALGQRFVGSHGLADSPGAHQHKEHPYTVVGRFQPTGTVLDRLILTSVESVWEIHGIHHAGGVANDADDDDDDAPGAAPHPGKAEVTALLVSYRSPAAAMRLPTFINRQTNLQAAVPAVETTRLLSLVGVGIDAIRIFALLLMLTAGLSIFVALYSALRQRESDMAMLRVMGASRAAIVGQILLEGLLLAGAGALLGLAIGHAAVALAASSFEQLREMGLTGAVFEPAEAYVVIGALVVGALAALIPAARIFSVDIADTLSRAA